MKNLRRYFPVLRNKRAEWGALGKLSADIAQQVMPVFEPLPVNLAKNGEAGVCEDFAERMEKNWHRRIFLDGHNLEDASGARLLFRLKRSALGESGRIIPVVRPDLGKETVGVMERWAKKVGRCAIRIQLERAITDPAGFEKYCLGLGLGLGPITLLLDRGIVGAGERLHQRAFSSVRGLDKYHDVVLVGGAFPKNLAGFKKFGQYQHPRHHWLSWLDTLAWVSSGMRRLKFGDYTIQHPIYEEPKAKVLNMSASIRYAAEEYWVIMRGEGVRNPGGAGYDQWPANAMLLTEVLPEIRTRC